MKIKNFITLMENPSMLMLKLRNHPWKMIKEHTAKVVIESNIKTVIDIGANEGQFAKTILYLLPDAKVYSFEPLLSCCAKVKKIAKKNKNLHVFNVAIGDQKGQTQFYNNQFSMSSSILKMLELHKQHFPETDNTKKIKVEIDTLDNIAKKIDLQDNILLKIDTQGYEDKVIKGGIETIKRIGIAIIELSFEPLYDGQPLFDDIYSIMKELGFKYKGNISQLESKIDGTIMQADGIFTNERFNI